MSELVAVLKRAQLLQNLCLEGGNDFITVQNSKADQGQKVTVVVLGPCSEAELCLVRALIRYAGLWGQV